MDGLSLSPVGMFLQAGPVGKAVMAVLLLASLWCWILIVEGVFTVVRLARALRAARAGASSPLLAPIEAAGRSAARLAVIGESVGEKRQRVAETMSRAGRELLMRAEGGLPNLAVISSVAPFVGLFGTVWGIMTSFAGIAHGQGHQPRRRRAGHRRSARRDRLRPRRRHPRLDRLQPHRRGVFARRRQAVASHRRSRRAVRDDERAPIQTDAA